MLHSKPANARAARLRERRREQGLRTVTIWLPDVRNPSYRRRLTAACDELARLSAVEAEADTAAGLADAFKHMPEWL